MVRFTPQTNINKPDLRGRISRFWLLLAGLLLGLVCCGLALIAAGAGHSWTAALPFGLLSLGLFPLAFSRLAKPISVTPTSSRALLALALGLDLLLVASTISEGIRYVNNVFGIAVLWVAVWSLWQIAALITLIKTRAINARR